MVQPDQVSCEPVSLPLPTHLPPPRRGSVRREERATAPSRVAPPGHAAVHLIKGSIGFARRGSTHPLPPSLPSSLGVARVARPPPPAQIRPPARSSSRHFAHRGDQNSQAVSWDLFPVALAWHQTAVISTWHQTACVPPTSSPLPDLGI